MRGLTGPILKSLAFIVATVLATGLLALTIINGSTSGGRHYAAVFTDVTSLNTGDDVRMAGVRVGQITSIKIVHHDQARVGFTVESDVRLARTVSATIRYRNLIGQRYIELDEGTGALSDPVPAGFTIHDTQPALNLTVLFNGFRPLFQALAPNEINDLSTAIVQVFQGEGPTVESLVEQTAQLSNTLADKDTVIDQVITNLDTLLSAVNGHGNQLSTLVSTLTDLVSGFAQDRAPLSAALGSLSQLTTGVADLLTQGRAPLKTSLTQLQTLSANLAGSSGALNSFLQTLPTKLTRIGRTASYGSWLNTYLCSITGRIPVPAGYYGGVGVQPTSSRCSA